MLPLTFFVLFVVLERTALAIKDCDNPLLNGITLTSSSALSVKFSAKHAQLTSNSAWCPKSNFTDREYLEANFSSLKLITRIKIKGEANVVVNSTARTVTKYLLQISNDGNTFYDLKQISQDDVSLEVNAAVVRFVPLAYDVFPCMRVAVYGCEARSQETCTPNNTCSQICVDHKDVCAKKPCDCPTDWSCHKYISCKCRTGYLLLNDGRTCKDIDECMNNNGGCDHNCKNFEGSYECSCRAGYKLKRDKHSCKDINECATNGGGCNQICDNRPGSYKCKCWTGYKMSSDNHTCVDIDECKVNNGGCSHTCINFAGGHKCACPVGFEVDKETGKRCVDTNECYLGNGGCEMFCNNNNGSYTCSCKDGFELYDTYKCRDIDECARNTDRCDSQSTTCSNYMGSYECRCKKGYKIIPSNSNKCELMSCAPLVKAQGTQVSPDSCLVKNSRKVGDKCSFSCEPGYKLPDPSKDTMNCLDTGYWDMPLISCRPVRCNAIAPPTNGYVFPPFCSSTGNLFGQSCYYRCNTGYSMKTGQKSKRDCKSDGNWDIQTGITCEKVYIKPWINCPPDVTIVLDPNANTADVSALLMKPKSNTKNVKMFPEKYRTSLVFPAGITSLKYVATSGNGATASCKTEVIIQDKTPPRVIYCPPNIYEVSSDPYKVISWKNPVFTDNVNVTAVTSNKKSGDTFYHGEVIVTYWARDAAGNVATCSLDVSLKRLECPTPKPPENGKLTQCRSFGPTHYCRITCDPGKQIFQFTYGANCRLPEAKWNEIPDCVDAKRINNGESCPAGMILQTSLTGYPTFIKYCVKCPRGYKYESKDCVKCPIGYTSMAESSSTCTKCPSGKSTDKPGSKTCLDQCKPGSISKDGFDIPLNPQGCSLCSMGYYSDVYGATKCSQCPSGLTTLAKGSKSKDSCGIAPTVTEFSPKAITVDEGDRVEFVCKATGPPTPAIKVTKVRPAPDVLGGPVKVESISSGSKQIGIRYIITRSTKHDEGLYSCEANNAFGKSTKFVNLIVEIKVTGSGAGASE